ncbi:DUF3549 family protein [Halomonas sp. YLGW01]|uniref:DUF3549 family protein n=1 Tax=Halomonas sp. YLGW01 TaxID=2773308 RepID=UPI0017870C2D|nr:DUF3549 family protein [Halomonas sp. YLGW01]
MQPILTLHDFFMRSGARVRLYHLGRRLAPCSLDDLAAFEAQRQPWAVPWQGQARLACVFTLGDVEEPLIWFLSLPLDEQGHLVAAPRDAFIERLLETLGHSVATLGEEHRVDNLMKDNPLAFTPPLPLQAMLHARANRDLDRPASEHLELAEDYLTGAQDDHPANQWQALGLQGLADFAIRHDTDQAHALAKRLPTLPNEVLHSLCYCLEHVTLAPALIQALRARGEQAAGEGDIETFCACVRAVSASQKESVATWYGELLDDPAACGPDLLAAMAARGWEHLEDAQRLPRYLERLAEQPSVDFTAVVRDLALIPRLRLPLLMQLRDAPADSPVGQRLAHLHR